MAIEDLAPTPEYAQSCGLQIEVIEGRAAAETRVVASDREDI